MELRVAAWLGQGWLRLARVAGLRSVDEGMPGLCRRVAAGERVPAVALAAVREFSFSIWWRAGMALVLLGFVLAGIDVSLPFGSLGMEAVLDAIRGVVVLFSVAAAEVAVQAIRMGFLVSWLRRFSPEPDEVMPSSSAGWPRWYDFWLAVAVGVVIAAIMAGQK